MSKLFWNPALLRNESDLPALSRAKDVPLPSIQDGSSPWLLPLVIANRADRARRVLGYLAAGPDRHTGTHHA